MTIHFTSIELRILASLVEKQICTPDYYPMTFNALVNACNQKSNRDPVTDFSELIVETGLDALRKKGLVRKVTEDTGRVPKYTHLFHQTFNLRRPLVAILIELILRGPQTVGELRTHCKRMHEFESLESVDRALEELSSVRDENPLVEKYPRQTGTKECRWGHLLEDDLLAGDAPASASADASSAQPAASTGGTPTRSSALAGPPRPAPLSSTPRILPPGLEYEDAMRKLEIEILALRKELAELRDEFRTLRKQIEYQ